MPERTTIRKNETLQAVILAAFTNASTADVSERLAPFQERDWRRLGSWLHASGLALYFLDVLRKHALCAAVPASVVDGLQQNQLDNCERTDSLIAEFVRLNIAFRQEGLDVLNVKGFSLGTDYCATPALRSQFDLDFWCSEDAAVQCKALLCRLGYSMVAASPAVLEFQAGEAAYPKLRDFYKARSQKSVEIHLRSAAEMSSVPRENGLLRSFVFPTLSREQAFILHATHLAKHLRSEWTRTSWMLELYRAIEAHADDEKFWMEIREQVLSTNCSDAIALAALASAKVFAFALPPELSTGIADGLPEGALRWVHEYAERAATAQFPGSKFYMLLERELTRDKKRFLRQRRSVLLPVRLPGRIAAPAGPRKRLQQLPSQAFYLAFRLAFHMREGWRLLRAERAWFKTTARCEGAVIREGRSIA